MRTLRRCASPRSIDAGAGGGLSGCGGCSCADDRLPPAGRRGAARRCTVVARELRGCGTPGFVPGDGYARSSRSRRWAASRCSSRTSTTTASRSGGETTADGNMHAFRYTDAGGVQDLGALAGFGAQSYASAIAPGRRHRRPRRPRRRHGRLFGHRYTASGGRTEICPGGCSVWDLNGQGQVVGLLPGRDTDDLAGVPLLARRRGCARSGRWAARAARPAASARRASSSATRSSPARRRSDLGHAFIYDPRDASPRLRDLNAVRRRAGLGPAGGERRQRAFIVGLRAARRAQAGASASTSRAARSWTSAPCAAAATASAGPSTSYGDVVGWAEDAADHNNAFVYAAGLGGMRRLGDFVDPARAGSWCRRTRQRHGMIVGWGYHNGAPRGFKLAHPAFCPAR